MAQELDGESEDENEEAAGEDLGVVRVPVRAFLRGQLLEKLLGDDVLDAVEVGVGTVAVKQRALGESGAAFLSPIAPL